MAKTVVDGYWSAVSTGAGCGLNGTVYAILVANGEIYIGGEFTNAGGDPNADRIAKFNGQRWVSVGGANTGLNGTVAALQMENGILYAGGSFIDAGGDTAGDGLAKFENGQWSSVDGVRFQSGVSRIVFSNGTLYAGGSFTNAGPNQNINYLAQFDGVSWSPVGAGGITGPVIDIELDGGNIYVAGNFQNAGGVGSADYLAVYNGSVWAGMGTLNNAVNDIEIAGGTVYLGGLFTNAGDDPNADYIAKFDGSLQHWVSLGGAGTGLPAWVTGLEITSGKVYVIGTFDNAGGDPNADRIAVFSGSTWTSIGWVNTGLDATPRSLAIDGNVLYAGGDFFNAGGDPFADKFAQFGLNPVPSPTPTNSNTPTSTATAHPALPGVWSALGGPNSGLNGQVFSILADGGTIYAGGSFTNAGGVAAADNVAKFSGGAWSAIGSGANFPASVYALTMEGTDLYIGGAFFNAAGNSSSDLIVKFSGGVFSPLSSGLGPNGRVEEIEVDSGTVYAGGTFFNVAGNDNLDYTAKFNGTAWEAVASSTLNGSVKDITVDGGVVYVAGEFTNAGGNPNADYIAVLSSGDWVPLTSTVLNNGVNTIAIFNGEVYAGGSFTNAGGDPDADFIAKLSGGVWSSVGPVIEPLNGPVEDIEFYEGVLYVSGHFINPGGNPYGDFIARYSGYNWVTINSDNNWINATVYDMGVENGVLYAGGNFNDGGGSQYADKIAKIGLVPFPTATPTATLTATSTITITPTLPASGMPSAPNGSTTQKNPVYSWAEVSGATQYKYQVYKGTALLFTKTVTSPVCVASRCTDTATNTLVNGEYRWHVQAFVGGVWQPNSSDVTFYVVPSPFFSGFESDANGWTQIEGSWSLSGGKYISTGVFDNLNSIAYEADFTALTFEVKMERNAGGSDFANFVMFRGKPTPTNALGRWNSGYYFAYTNSGYFIIGYFQNNVFHAMTPWLQDLSITGIQDTLKVSASSDVLYFYINGVMVAYGAHPTLSSGKVGVGFYHGGPVETFRVDWASLKPSGRGGIGSAAELEGAINLGDLRNIDIVEGVSPFVAGGTVPDSIQATVTATSAESPAEATATSQATNSLAIPPSAMTPTLPPATVATFGPTNTPTLAQLAIAEPQAASSKRMQNPHPSYPKESL